MYSFIKKNRIYALLIPLILYWIILFIGTSLPSDHVSGMIEVSDKLKHFGAYFILAFLLSLNLYFQERWKNLAFSPFIYAFLACTIYGVIDELHQILVPNRSAEFLDWLADLSGSFVGVIFSALFLKYIKKNNSGLETN